MLSQFAVKGTRGCWSNPLIHEAFSRDFDGGWGFKPSPFDSSGLGCRAGIAWPWTSN